MNDETLARIKADAMATAQLEREIAAMDRRVAETGFTLRLLPRYRRLRKIYAAELGRRKFRETLTKQSTQHTT